MPVACSWGRGAVCAVLVLSFALGSLISVSAAADDRAGPAFAFPAELVPMPDDWVATPVRRNTPEPVDLALSLDQQLHPALMPLIERFAREHKVRIAVEGGTCGVSASAIEAKSADIAGFCCPPGPMDRLPGLRFHTIGIGALALIGHPDNPVDDLTSAQVRGALGGDLMTWGDLPMTGMTVGDGPVRAVARLHCKLRPGHWRLILGDEDEFSPDAFEVAAITDMIRQVARIPTAIGYETLWHIATHANEARVRPIRVDGFAPDDDEALAQGRYPFYRVFNITSWEGAAHSGLGSELAAYLVAWAPAIAPEFQIVPAQKLRAAGWRFVGDELVAPPKGGAAR